MSIGGYAAVLEAMLLFLLQLGFGSACSRFYGDLGMYAALGGPVQAIDRGRVIMVAYEFGSRGTHAQLLVPQHTLRAGPFPLLLS